MRFKPDTLGTLVRPRVLTKAIVYTLLPPAGTEEDSDRQNFWAMAKRSNRFERFALYNTPFNKLFNDLSLGNTGKDLNECYVGVITHYMVNFHGTYHIVDASNVKELLSRVKKTYGNRANLKVSSVGLKFYKGMKRDEYGTLIPVNPWGGTGTHVWFYNRKDIVPMEDIIRYENARLGDLVLFPKAKGIVVKHKTLNKPRFYSTSSWTCKAITLLNGSIDGFTRFLPDRTFKVRKPTDPMPPEMLEEDEVLAE